MENEIYTEEARLEPIVKDHMDRIHEINQRSCKEHGIASMSVCCATDLLDKGAFIGGVTMAFHGSTQNQFEMLYQLVITCYNGLVAESNERYANILWNSFSKQVIAKKEHFSFGMVEFAEGLAEGLLKMLSEKDKDTEDSDENRE